MTSAWRALRRRILTPNVSRRVSGRARIPRRSASRAGIAGNGRADVPRPATRYAAEARVRGRRRAPAGERPDAVPRVRLRGRRHGLRHAATACRSAGADHVGASSPGRGAPTTSTWSTSGSAGRWRGCPGSAGRGCTPRTRCCAGWCSTATASTRRTSTPTQYVDEQYQDAAVPVAGRRPAAGTPTARIDQGIGRALWFVGGTDADAVADLIDGSPSGGAATCTRRRAWPRPTPAAPTRTSCARSGERAGEHRPQRRAGLRVRRRGPGARRPRDAAHRRGHRGVLRARPPRRRRPASRPRTRPDRAGRRRPAGVRGVAAAASPTSSCPLEVSAHDHDTWAGCAGS